MHRYWLTIHWPHPVNPADDCPWFIYLQHSYRSKGEQVSPGDKVVFYETASGKAHRQKVSQELVRLKKGRQAVVGIADVVGPLRASTMGLNIKEYGDGETLNWAWELPCTNHRWGDEVASKDVLAILGRGNMRVRSGLMELDASEFDELRRQMKV